MRSPAEPLPVGTLLHGADAPGPGILVVDNDRATCSALTRMLEAFSAAVFPAPSHALALKMFEDNRPHISILLVRVLLDDGNGLELAARLRVRKPGLKVLYMSACNDSVTVNGPLDPDSDALRKPVRRRELISKVRRLTRTERSELAVCIDAGS